MKVEEKKRAFEEWLQCNNMKKYERYREKNVETKQKAEEVKRMSDFRWGQDFNRCMRRIKRSKERWIEDGRDRERCEWTVVERKRGEEKMS